MNSNQKRVLCLEDRESSVGARRSLLESGGFEVLTAHDPVAGLALIAARPVDALVVDDSVFDAGGAADYTQLRQRNPRAPIVLVSEGAFVPEPLATLADVALAKEQDPTLLLSRLESLIRLRNHSHPELEKEYVVFVDSERRYVDCSDGACRLLGFTRRELLNMTIDDVSFNAGKTSALFERYVKGGGLDGQYILKHRSGESVFIRYEAHVFSDGCMAAVWETVEDWKQVYQSALLEFDLEKLKDQIEITEMAIQHRQQELTKQGTRDLMAWQELEDALSGLKVLRKDLL